MQPGGATDSEVVYFGCFALGVSLVYLIVMTSACVVNKYFELLEFVVFNSVYVDLKYNEVSLTFTVGYVWCVVMWSPWSVCEVVSVPYVDAVVAATPMHVLLFMLHVCMPRECDGVK